MNQLFQKLFQALGKDNDIDSFLPLATLYFQFSLLSNFFFAVFPDYEINYLAFCTELYPFFKFV